MISISCEHPDLEEFIEVKSDLEKVTKANISVRITDKFMQAVKNREKFKVSFTRDVTGEVIEKEIDAYKLFHKLCEMNWDYAEPGMLFWDRIENYNLLSEDENFHYAGTNPCFSGDMQLLTVDGYKAFSELCDTEPYIYNVNGNIVKSKVWCSGEKDTVKIKTAKGEIICTPDHRFMTIDGEECMAKDLKGKYIMPCTTINKKFNERFIKYGFIQGDGQLKRINSKYHEGIEVNIGEKDTDIYDLFSNEDFTIKSDRSIYVQGFKNDLIDLGFCGENLPEREFPYTYDDWTKIEKASFLHGCYSANGSVIKNGRISYKTTCKSFAEKLCETLLNDFDIRGAYITTNKPKKIQFANGEYECRESYDVNIGQYKEITKFMAEINFYQQYKREQIAQMIKSRPTYVYNVLPGEKMKVYDFTEPERHWGIVEGYIVHNCAEEPLPAGGSCLLGSINLSEFVNEDKTFDYTEFRRVVDLAVGALNDVLDEGLPLHPLQEQRDSVRDWRQIGIGIFGLADMLIKMRIRYGSEDAIALCNAIGFTMANQALLSSNMLAESRGVYPKFNAEAVIQSRFLYNNLDIYDYEKIKERGLHNSQLLTIAPTGSLSSMLGVSGGIEPIYANYYERKTESLHGHDEYYKVYTPIVKKYMEEHELTDDEILPDYFITAQNLNYVERIKMQAVWQNHIDASISSTVNVPNDFTVEETEKLYMLAWENGLKGVTIYRDGCKRAGILSTGNTDKKHEEETAKKLERGMIIKVDNNSIGKERHLTTGCGSLHCAAFFDPDTGDLLETYLSKGSSGGCQSNLAAVSRLVSLSARGGVDVYSIVDQLKSCMSCPAYAVRSATKHDTSKGNCCPSAVGNALIEMYEEMRNELFDDEKEETEKPKISPKKVNEEVRKAICPECGNDLRFEGGCISCVSCGYSKCE